MEEKKHSYQVHEVLLMMIVALYLITLLIFGLVFVFSPFGEKIAHSMIDKNDPNFSFYNLSFVVFMSGLVGGTFYAIRGMYRRLTSDGTKRNSEFEERFDIKIWFFWYIVRPLQGGVLSLIILSMLNAGFVGLSNIKDPNTQTLYFQISLGFLVGYGLHEVLKKVDEIIKVTFSSTKKTQHVTDESKDKLADNKDEGLSV